MQLRLYSLARRRLIRFTHVTLVTLVASIGGNTIDSNFQEGSKIGKIFHMKPKEIADLYKHFKEHVCLAGEQGRDMAVAEAGWHVVS